MEAEQYETLRDKLHDIFSVGTQINSKSFGIGTILKSDGSDAIVVDFPSQMKPISMGLGFSLAQNLISCPNDEVRTLVSENKNILNRGSTGSINYIFENLVAAEHEYDKYEAYLEL